MMESASFLKSTSILGGLPDDVLGAISERLTSKSYAAGDLIIEEGVPGTALYIVGSGQVEVLKKGSAGESVHLAYINPGEFFGEMSLLSDEPTSASVVASQYSEVLAVSKDDFKSILLCNPNLYHQFTVTLSSRLRSMDHYAVEAKHKEMALSQMLRDEKKDRYFDFIGKTKNSKMVHIEIGRAAMHDENIIIYGEKGVGKELVARMIHDKSNRANKPFITVDCHQFSREEWGEKLFGAKPSSQISHLPRPFGYMELAEGGTLLLKNVELLSLAVQKRLREAILAAIKSAGNDKSRRGPELRIIATSRTDLKARLASGLFDCELYAALSRHLIHILPLRERKRDVPELVAHFLEKHSRRLNKKVSLVQKAVMETLISHNFVMGNVQELEEVVERAVILTDQEYVGSEHVFLGLPHGKSKYAFNLFKLKWLKEVVRKGAWPGAVRYIAAGVFALIFIALARKGGWLGKDLGLALVWSIWWPALVLSFFFAARAWCAICPLASFGKLCQKIKLIERPVPNLLKKYDFIIGPAGFLAIIFIEESTHMRSSPAGTIALLGTLLAGAGIFYTLYQRDTWCHHICPLGKLASVCSMASILEVRSNPDICANQCATHECYRGNGESEGCPLFQHVMFVNTNQNCKLCFNCLKSCPHDSIQLNLRPPAQEIWSARAFDSRLHLFVAMLMGISIIMFLYQATRWSGWEYIQGNLLLFTAVFLSAALIPIGLIKALGYGFFAGKLDNQPAEKNKLFYAYIPLILAAFAAFELHFVPGIEKLSLSFSLSNFWGADKVVLEWPLQYLFDILALGIGLLLSAISFNKIISKWKAKNDKYKLAFSGVNLSLMLAYAVAVYNLCWIG